MNKCAQQFVWLQRAFGMGSHMMRIFVKVSVDQIHRYVLGIVVGFARLRCQIGSHDFAASIK